MTVAGREGDQPTRSGFLIDSGSALELVRVFTSRNRTEAADPWAWGTARAVTSLLLFSDEVLITAPPTGRESDESIYPMLRSGLTGVARGYLEQDDKEAMTRARQWATTAKLQEVVEETRSHPQFAAWERYAIEHLWPMNIARHGGLFDLRFSRQIARFLNLTEKDVRRLHLWTASERSRRELRDAYRGKARSETLDEVRSGYIASAVVRARYYGYAVAGRQIQHSYHPSRQFVFVDPLHSVSPIEVGQFEWFLSNIVLSSAFVKRKPEMRAKAYLANLEIVRRARQSGAFAAAGATSEQADAALSHAADEAIRLKIECSNHLIEFGLDIALSASLGVILWFAPTPHVAYVPGVLGTVSEGTLARSKAAQRILRRTGLERRHLRSLALAGPGRAGFQHPSEARRLEPGRPGGATWT
ncbi:MAG: hypothetical protein M0Z46_10215 [Actinomycetota bacterium]|nr:hypothetical protein [Actinomycetota bacterium]